MQYRIRIEEVLSKFVRVEADSHDEAVAKVEKMFSLAMNIKPAKANETRTPINKKFIYFLL